MKINFSTIISCFCIIFLASCSKDEGEGGTSTIKGKVMVRKYDNSFQTLLSESTAPDESVFIIYGSDHDTYDNDYKTSFNGEYEFKYLQKGTYKIFAYTTDTAGVAVTGYIDENKPKIPMFVSVEVTKNGSTVTAPELTILKNNKQGSSSIHGKILLQHWDATFSLMDTSYYVHDQDVYIIAGSNNQTYFDDYKTSWNGEYYFNQLPAGDYRIFTYSPDTTGVAQMGVVDFNLPKVPVFVDVNIPGNGVNANAQDIVIFKFN
ncbi:hypothetical protein BH11BAC1_BH11BAC1_12820 [soil metagenome]